MPKTGPNIYKRKDGRWEGRFIRERVNGKAKYSSVYAGSYRELRTKLDIAKREAERKAPPVIKAGTLSELSRCWLADISSELKESSVVKYEDILRCHIIPAFGGMELSDITNDHLIGFVKRLRGGGDGGCAGLSVSSMW